MSAHDFDFLFAGPWHVENRRLAGGTWERFGARSDVRRVAGGHLDELSIPEFPGGAIEAFTVRLYEPEADLWRIWWSSSARPGHLDPPMVGRFVDGIGVFEGDDVEPGVRLRFTWDWQAPRWEQARSRDGGATWTTDWTMDLTRLQG